MTATTGWSRALVLAILLALVGSAEGCAAIEGIFKAGVWVGVAIAVLIVGAVLFLLTRVRGQ